MGCLFPEGSLSSGVSVLGVSVQGSLSRKSLSREGSLPTERGFCVQGEGVLCPGGLCLGGLCLRCLLPEGSLSSGVSVWGSLSNGLSLSWEFSVHGVSVMENGQYASYWNDFLLPYNYIYQLSVSF